jgi:hypothetical protein
MIADVAPIVAVIGIAAGAAAAVTRFGYRTLRRADDALDGPFDFDDEPDAATYWRIVRACDCIDEMLADRARVARECGLMATAHNIAIARHEVGLIRDKTTGTA